MSPTPIALGWTIVADRLMAHVAFSAYIVVCNALLRLPGHRFRIAVLRRIVGAEIEAGSAIERGGPDHDEGRHRHRRAHEHQPRLPAGRQGRPAHRPSVNISPDVRLITAEHDPDSPDFAGRVGGVVVGDSAWLALGAVILPGTRIEEGALVGAAAVVRGHVPARTIVAGNPAVAIGTRAPRGATRATDLSPVHALTARGTRSRFSVPAAAFGSSCCRLNTVRARHGAARRSSIANTS